jgi:ubiquinone/menaquinone biosynthesis C-methylase UbiE
MAYWISYSDWIELREKTKASGWNFVWNKLHFSAHKRVKQQWKHRALPLSNWWNIPRIRQRWNAMATGDQDVSWQAFLCDHFIAKDRPHHLLSIGCGTGTQELQLASLSPSTHITAFDLTSSNIHVAQQHAKSAHISNIDFLVSDFYTFKPEKLYDYVLFYSSLHHLQPVSDVLQKVYDWLKPGGLVIIHEYTGPNRIQWNKEQLQKVNDLLKILPQELKTFTNSHYIKCKQTAPGLLRMMVSDPSEAPDSESIIPALHSLFTPIYWKGLGGNILAPLLKGISHHFVEETPINHYWLSYLTKEEDRFLEHQTHDHYFGIFLKSK